MTMKVKTRFTADEDVSSIARRIDENVRRMNQNMKRGFRESSKSALGFKEITKSILTASVIQKGFGALAGGVSNVASEFVSFDDAITAAAVRFKDIGPEASNFKEQLDILKKSARDAGATTVKSATQSAQALDFLARAGFTSREAMGSLRTMINLSIATGEDFARVADMSSDLLGAFGLAADDPIQKIKNLTRLNDVLVKTANSANVTVEDMFETMKDIGPIAAGILNVSLEEVAAQTAILGNSGIKETNAMTALKNAYLNLAAPVGAGADVLKAFNTKLSDGKGGVRSLTDVLKELNEKMAFKGLDPIQQAAVMDAIFGKRAIAGAKNLQQNINNVESFREMLGKAGGTAERTANVIQQSLGNRILTLGSSLIEFGFKILAPLEDDIKGMIDTLTEFFRADPKPLVNAIKEAISYFKELTKNITVEDVHKKINEIIADIRAFFIEAKDFFNEVKSFVETANKVKKGFGFASEEELRKDALKRVLDLDPKKQAEAEKAKKELLANKIAAERRAAIERSNRLSMLARQEEAEAERKAKEERAKALIPPSWSPDVNVNVTNQVNAKNVEVDTTVTAPGTQGAAGINLFF